MAKVFCQFNSSKTPALFTTMSTLPRCLFTFTNDSVKREKKRGQHCTKTNESEITVQGNTRRTHMYVNSEHFRRKKQRPCFQILRKTAACIAYIPYVWYLKWLDFSSIVLCYHENQGTPTVLGLSFFAPICSISQIFLQHCCCSCLLFPMFNCKQSFSMHCYQNIAIHDHNCSLLAATQQAR